MTWSFNFGDGLVPWIGNSAPDSTRLLAARSVKSNSSQGHVPVWAYSTTVTRHLRLESGLEHDLFRDLDRKSEVVWLVAQPCKVTFPGDVRLGHVPDLLSLRHDGQVTLWDVRPVEKQDNNFERVALLTAAASEGFGWSYEVFPGHSTTRRINLIWLDGFRRDMPWYEASLDLVRRECGQEFSLADVLAVDAGNGQVMSAVWNATRTGVLETDLELPLRPATTLRFREVP